MGLVNKPTKTLDERATAKLMDLIRSSAKVDSVFFKRARKWRRLFRGDQWESKARSASNCITLDSSSTIVVAEVTPREGEIIEALNQTCAYTG